MEKHKELGKNLYFIGFGLLKLVVTPKYRSKSEEAFVF